MTLFGRAVSRLAISWHHVTTLNDRTASLAGTAAAEAVVGKIPRDEFMKMCEVAYDESLKEYVEKRKN